MINGSACYSISNQSPSNARSYESLVAQRRILTASKSFSDGLNFRETPLPTMAEAPASLPMGTARCSAQILTGDRWRAKFRKARRPGGLNQHRFGSTLLPTDPTGGSATAFPGQARPQLLHSAAEVGTVSPSPVAGLHSPPASGASLGRAQSGLSSPRARPSEASEAGGPFQPRLLPLRTLPIPRPPRGMFASPLLRAALPGAPGGRFMSGKRDAGPAAAASPGPACSARLPPGEVGCRRERGSSSAALPRGRRQCWPAGPRDGTEARNLVPAAREEGRQETPDHSSAGVFILSCLRPPGRPRRTAPDLTPLPPDALPGASAASGRSRRCPAGGTHSLPPLRPSPPLGSAAPRGGVSAAPPRSASAPLLTAPLPPPSQGKTASHGWAQPLRCKPIPSPPGSSSAPEGSVFGWAQAMRPPLNASKLSVRG